MARCINMDMKAPDSPDNALYAPFKTSSLTRANRRTSAISRNWQLTLRCAPPQASC